MKLKGHTDNIRALVLNRDGSQVRMRNIAHSIPERERVMNVRPSASRLVRITRYASGHWVNSDVSVNFKCIRMLFGLSAYVLRRDSCCTASAVR